MWIISCHYDSSFGRSDDGTGKACSVTCFAISQAAPDQLCRHASLVAPLAFFAMHQETTGLVSVNLLFLPLSPLPVASLLN